jgi:hypothetical protein
MQIANAKKDDTEFSNFDNFAKKSQTTKKDKA